MTEQDYQNQEQDRRIKWLEDHYTTFNSEFGEVKADVKWLKKFFWIVATASIGSFVSQIYGLIERFN